jgi:spore maturation protein SpmB
MPTSGKAGLDLAFYVLLPVLVIMMAIMKVAEARGILALVARSVQPVLRHFGIPGAGACAIMQMLLVSFAAPLATKYLAGGTAMMGVAVNLLREGAITARELNRMAGFMTNPCDLVDVAVLMSAGQRCASVARPAIAGVVVGVLLRGVLHQLIF